MANSEVVDLMSYGTHCDVDSCNQLDFLPFKCSKCSGVFCVDHRQEKTHNCPNADLGDTKVPICPICKQPILISKRRGEDENSQVEKHIMSGCRRLIAAQPKRSKANRCTHSGCKRKDLVPYVCPQCERVVCMRHRQPLDHRCMPQAIPVH